MGQIDITEVGRRTGLASSALRFYERKGLVRPSGRRGGKRTYDESVVEQVAFIDLLKLAGFTLTEIAGFVNPDGRVAPDWRTRAKAKSHELRVRIEELRGADALLQHTIDCPHRSLDECPVHKRVVVAHAAAMAM